MTSFSTGLQGHALRARQGASLGKDSEHERGSPGQKRVTSGRPAAGAGVEGGTRRWWAAAWPAASSAAAHRRGPLPQRSQPRTRPSDAPAVTHPLVAAPARAIPGGPPAPDSLTLRKDHHQGRAQGHVACGDGVNATLDTDLPRRDRHLSAGRKRIGGRQVSPVKVVADYLPLKHCDRVTLVLVGPRGACCWHYLGQIESVEPAFLVGIEVERSSVVIIVGWAEPSTPVIVVEREFSPLSRGVGNQNEIGSPA